ncbi:uncharacterized protein DS421_20g678320 [Arachis hypogaea]|nr:uncharacterized protein DS421_20g678320 [Arachis hypogaea]
MQLVQRRWHEHMEGAIEPAWWGVVEWGFEHPAFRWREESLGAVRRTAVGGVIAAAPVGGVRDQPVVEVVRGGEGADPLCQVPL